MSDPLETSNSVDVGGAMDAPDIGGTNPTGAAGGADGVDVDALLSQFDQATKAPAAKGETPARADAQLNQPDARGYSEDDLMRLQLGEVSNRVVLQSVLEHQIAHTERLHQEQLQRQEREDFEETVEEAARMLEGAAHVGDPKEFAKRWLLAEAQLDPRLHEAWQHRRDSSEHQAFAVRALKNAFKKLRGEVDRMPDPELTADRWAVMAAMRGASTTPPEGRAPDYSRMTDSQLQAEKDRLFAAG